LGGGRMAWLKKERDPEIEKMKSSIKSMIDENNEEAEILERTLEYIKFLEREKYENDLILMTADNRKYRKKYLAEERKKDPKLLYPDADEIYMKYFMQRHIIQLMAQEIYLLDREVPYSGKNGNIYAWTGTDEIINYFTSQIEKIFEVKK
jgi:hypothetical protein